MSRLRWLATAASLCLVAADLEAQVESPPPQVVIRLRREPVAFRLPREFQPGGRYGPRVPAAIIGRRWLEETRARLAQDRRSFRRAQPAPPPPVVPRRPRPDVPTPQELAPSPGADSTPQAPTSLDAFTEYADLGVDLNARLELKFDRLKNARCNAANIFSSAAGCIESFPAPTVDQQFNIRAGGVVSERVHVNVDFDTQREFNANNSIRVFYQGLEDEILRRVDVGTVTFDAPPSRFITSGIPSNSFGVQAEAQVGPINFRSIFARQRGSAIRTRQFTVGDAATQPVDFETRDLDFEVGRFFFVADPRQLPRYPDVDVLTLERALLPPALQLAEVRVYRLRAQTSQVEGNANLGGIDAVAVRPDSPQRVGPFSWELLVEGADYYLDPSSLWFALTNSVGREDFLAVSYVTVAGDTVGTFPEVNAQGDTLLLVYEPQRGPEVPTFFHEFRNVYRLGSRDVDRASISLALLVKNSETPLDGQGNYLSRFGLSLAADASTLDEFNRVFPRFRDPNAGAPITDLFVVFPHVAPFADSSRLLPGEINDSLYRMPTHLIRTQGPAPIYTFHFHYEASGAGDRSSISLGAFQVRAESERISIGERVLVRGREYDIDYSLGQITFFNPDSLFLGLTEVNVEFEENQLFDDAPKDILGFSSSYSLGRTGTINAVGIFQNESTTSTRPTLGLEPEALFIGGVSTQLQFEASGLTSFLDGLPLLSTTVPSTLALDGELAVSQPNSNRTGVAYIEDFELQPRSPIRLGERLFQLAGAPSSGLGLPPNYLDATGNFSPQDAVPLVWQNLVQSDTGIVQFRSQDIDTSLVIAGSGLSLETVLWLTLKPDTVGGAPDPLTGVPRWFRPANSAPRWRSITQPLGGGSGVGLDLTRAEFFEFWLLEDADQTARQEGAYFAFDFGTVLEDAVDFGPTIFTVAGQDTTFDGFQFVGTGRLDAEKDSLTSVYNASEDDIGIRGDRLDSIQNGNTGAILNDFPLCDVRGRGDFTSFPLGNLLARCSRGNGSLDTEDLDGDNRLDINVGAPTENYVRYVFPVGDSRFFVREGGSTVDSLGRTLTWRLYRIPMRQDTVEVGNPNFRQVPSLRLTVVAPGQATADREFSLALARMGFGLAPWLKRADAPLQGISGNVARSLGEVSVAVVTTEDTQLGYESPPGVIDEPPTVGSDLGFGTQEVNETALRLLARGLRADERTEAFLRFVDAADRNFLKYRRLRVWARGRGAGWEDGDLEFFVKVGQDEHNFYMYRAPIKTTTWLPEVVVDIDRWVVLRAEIENRWLRGSPPDGSSTCGGDSTAFVACDGPYLVQVRDPASTPPNLARVSEIAVGILRVRESVTIDVAELWANDIRLTDVVDKTGLAGALDLRLAAADFMDVFFGFSGRDDQFRQVGENPRYITDTGWRLGTLVRLDKLLPEQWGLSMPLNVQYARSNARPFLIDQSDILADSLQDLREPNSSVTSIDVTLLRSRRGTSFVERSLLDPLTVRAHRLTGSDVTSFSSAETRNHQLLGDYLSAPRSRSVPGAPQFLVSLIDALPGFIRNSEFADGLRTSRLRLNPRRVRLYSTLTNNRTVRSTFRVPVSLDIDSILRPSRRIMHMWRNGVELDFRPYSTFGFRGLFESTRDLQDYGDSTVVGRVIRTERRELFGLDVGFERARRISTGLDLSPVVNTWLQPRFLWTSSYNFFRDPNGSRIVRTASDTSGAFRAPETMTNSRLRQLGATVDLAQLVRSMVGDSSGLAQLFAGFLPADVSFDRELRSGFNDIVFDPSLAYQLALGTLDDFRVQDGASAASTGELKGVTATGGVRLPLGAQFRLNYRDSRSTFWFLRAEGQQRNEQRSREWPSLTASWLFVPGGWLLDVLSSLTAQLQYRVVDRTTFLPQVEMAAGMPTERIVQTDDRTNLVSPAVNILWLGGVSTGAAYTSSTNRSVTSGNRTDTEREEWNGSVAFTFRAPALVSRMGNQIRTTATFNSLKNAVCLIQTNASECRTVSDSRRQSFDLQLETGLSATLRGGATFSYVVNELRHVANKVSQVLFTIYIDLALVAGEIR